MQFGWCRDRAFESASLQLNEQIDLRHVDAIDFTSGRTASFENHELYVARKLPVAATFLMAYPFRQLRERERSRLQDRSVGPLTFTLGTRGPLVLDKQLRKAGCRN